MELAHTNDACPLNIINKTNNVIMLLWIDLTLARSERFKSNFSFFEAAEAIFLPEGAMTKYTFIVIILPKIIPDCKKANREP